MQYEYKIKFEVIIYMMNKKFKYVVSVKNTLIASFWEFCLNIRGKITSFLTCAKSLKTYDRARIIRKTDNEGTGNRD